MSGGGAKRRKVLITGAGGQLGASLSARLSERWEVLALDHRSLDIADADRVRREVAQARPHWIINCAAWTDVDGAESHPQDALRANAGAVRTLADAALEADAKLCHFSSDYVFSGESSRPYLEGDPTGPINAYGASKLAGEELLAGHPARSAVLRTSWLYSESGANFFRTMLRLGAEAARSGVPLRVVDDQTGTPTDVHHLCQQVETVIEEDLLGLFHSSCEGQATWFEFARKIFEVAGMPVPLQPVTTAEMPRAARRPRFSVLENQRLKDLGRNRMMDWQAGLQLVWKRRLRLAEPR